MVAAVALVLATAVLVPIAVRVHLFPMSSLAAPITAFIAITVQVVFRPPAAQTAVAQDAAVSAAAHPTLFALLLPLPITLSFPLLSASSLPDAPAAPTQTCCNCQH